MDGIRLNAAGTAAEPIRIRNNVFTGEITKSKAIETPSYAGIGYAEITDNQFSNAKYAIWANSLSHALISRNTVSDIQYTGFAFDTSDVGRLDEITISDNTLTGCGVLGSPTYPDYRNAIRLSDTVTRVTITGNFLTNSAANGIYLAERRTGVTPGPTDIVITNNSITGSGAYGVVNAVTEGSSVVDASGNWWGTADPAAVKQLMSGAVDYTPWLAFGAEDPTAGSAVGFQGDFSYLHVDDDSPQTASQGGRIQEGIDLLADGSLTGAARTVQVAAGTYAENVTAFKALTLWGAQHGLDARGRSATESTIQSPDGGVAIDVTASGVTVDGFRVVDGVVQADGSGLTVANNIFQVNAGNLNKTLTGNQTAVIGLGDVGGTVAVNQNAISITGTAGAPGFTLDPLQAQAGWSGGAQPDFTNNDTNIDNGDGTYGDEKVTSAAAHSGTNSWRYSRGYGSPGQGTPFSPLFGATFGRPSSGATGDTATMRFAFKAVSPGDGSKQNLYEGTADGGDRTGGHIYLENTAGGVRLYMYDGLLDDYRTLATVDGANWHTVKMTTVYHEDLAQDLTTYVIDEGQPGAIVATGTTWIHLWREGYAYPYTPGARFKFASSFDGNPAIKGFYYDDLSLEIASSSQPTVVLASYSTSFEGDVPAPQQVDGMVLSGNASALTSLTIGSNFIAGGNINAQDGRGVAIAATSAAGT